MLLKNAITDIFENRNIQIVDLHTILGYKSKTSLARILNGTVRPSTLFRFEADLNQKIDLTQAERIRLHDCILTKLYGHNQVDAFHELSRLLSNNKFSNDTPIRVRIDNTREMLISDYFAMKNDPAIYVFNSVYPGLVQELSKLLKQGIGIHHYILETDNIADYIRTIRMMIDLFSDRNYRAYMLSSEMVISELQKSNCVLLRSENDIGETIYEMILFETPSRGIVVHVPDSMRDMIPSEQTLNSFKLERSSKIDSLPDLIKVFTAIEDKSTILDLKPDPCFAYIPANILLHAFTDSGFTEVFGHGTVTELYNYSKARENNIYTKKSPTTCIMRCSALKQFADTGVLTDHPSGMRPFTPREREAIFTRMLDAENSNPYFSMVLLDDDNLLPNLNLCCYKDKALFISKSSSNYLGDQAEEMILKPPKAFYEIFEQYCQIELISRHGLQRNMVIRTIQNLIDSCRTNL